VTAQRVVPVPDERSAGYWSACARHVLALARCANCGHRAMPPDVVCTNCWSSTPDFVFEPVSGRGVVRSWTVLHDSFLPGFEDDLPFTLVDVELDDQPGLRMIGRLLVEGPVLPHLGQRVAVAFEDLAPGVALPGFVPEGGGEEGIR